jgi:hypothetical protein
MHDLVIADIQSRKDFGLAKYGTPLQAGNGRDGLKDAYEEAIDLLVYLRQGIEERAKSGQQRWSAEDLDRCKHGRHSIDSCFDCVKPTNRFLMAPSTISIEERVRHLDGIWEVRIGTMVHGEPIWVVARDKPRD